MKKYSAEELWWNRMNNAVRFREDVLEALLSGKSVVMQFPDTVPFQEAFQEQLTDQLAERIADRTTDIFPAPEISPGAFLFRQYCTEQEQSEYWPLQTYAEFLAEHPQSALSGRFVCIRDIRGSACEEWLHFLSEYLAKAGEHHAQFVLWVQGGNVHDVKQTVCLHYTDYVTDYDCLMLCLTMTSETACSSLQKQYIAETASSIAGQQVETAAKLTEFGNELIAHPLQTAEKVLPEMNGSARRVLVTEAVWRAQIKMIFPKLEEWRKAFLQEHRSKLEKCLPIQNGSGERIDKVEDLEIGQLYHICRNNRITDPEAYHQLIEMRNARNSLSHLDPIPWENLQKLKLMD